MTRSWPALVALTVLAFALRSYALWGPEPIGTDGYYYLVQIEDWAQSGRLHVPDASWALRFLALPHAAGLPSVAGLVVAASVLAALVVPAAAFIDPKRAIPLGVVAAASPNLTHLAGDFPKSVALAAPLLIGIGALSRSNADRRWLLLAFPALGLAATAHRLGAVFAALVLLAWALSQAGRAAWLALGAVTVVILAFLLLSSFLPGLLHLGELDRVTGQLRMNPWPPAPWSWLQFRPDTHTAQIAELLLPWLALPALPIAYHRAPNVVPLLAAALVPVWFPFYAADGLDLGYRVSLFGPLLAASIVVLAMPTTWPRWPTLLCLPTALIGPTPSTTPPYAAYRSVIQNIPQPLPDLLIAHQGMNFLYDHTTHHEAMAWAPDLGTDPTTVGRVVWGIEPGEWMAVFPEEAPAIVSLGLGYDYVREDVWNALLNTNDPSLTRRIDDWRNPTARRPQVMLRGR